MILPLLRPRGRRRWRIRPLFSTTTLFISLDNHCLPPLILVLLSDEIILNLSGDGKSAFFLQCTFTQLTITVVLDPMWLAMALQSEPSARKRAGNSVISETLQ